MSYARFVESDVYVFHSVGGFGCCQICSLMPTRIVESGLAKGAEFHEDFNTASREEMIAHLMEHVKNGDSVPDRAIQQLTKELIEEGDTFEE
jgi:hypothetical protein